MKKYLFLTAIIGLLCASCSKEGEEPGAGKNWGTFTMQGEFSPGFTYGGVVIVDAGYFYSFDNYSSHEVRVTVKNGTKTILPYAPLTGFVDYVSYIFYHSDGVTSSVSVSYYPADKVNPVSQGAGEYRFYNK